MNVTVNDTQKSMQMRKDVFFWLATTAIYWSFSFFLLCATFPVFDDGYGRTGSLFWGFLPPSSYPQLLYPYLYAASVLSLISGGLAMWLNQSRKSNRLRSILADVITSLVVLLLVVAASDLGNVYRLWRGPAMMYTTASGIFATLKITASLSLLIALFAAYRHKLDRISRLLPLLQVAAAIVLTMNNHLRTPFSGKNAADQQFLDALNAPAALTRDWLLTLSVALYPEDRFIKIGLNIVIYFVLIGLLWYLVCMEATREPKAVLTSNIPIRIAFDGSAIVFGVVLAVVAFLVRRQFEHISIYSNIVAVPYLIWGITIAIFYGRDLWLLASRNKEGPMGLS